MLCLGSSWHSSICFDEQLQHQPSVGEKDGRVLWEARTACLSHWAHPRQDLGIFCLNTLSSQGQDQPRPYL